MTASATVLWSWLSRWWRPDAARTWLPARPQQPVVRVVTWNIHHGADAWDHLDLEAIAARLDDCDADVVALQEVDRHWGERSDEVDQAGWLARRLRMHAVHGATVRKPRRHGPEEGSYGNALLSRQPWVSRRVTSFDQVPRLEPRGLVTATTRTPVGMVRFASTHLSTRHPSQRAAEVGQLLAAVAADRAADVTAPVVVAGDFNAEPRDAELGGLADTLTDAWRSAGSGLGDTHPAGRPWRRIDQVWVGGLRPVSASVLATEASDHLPVVVDLARPAAEPPVEAG